MCTHSKREVYHKEGNCLELEANKVKSYTGVRATWNRMIRGVTVLMNIFRTG